ncbi:MAG: MBL fold metallo-hydrolase [Bacteroidota bacterium]
MLNITFFTFNAFDENTYLISNERNQCWIVDPGMSDEQENATLLAYLSEQQLVPQAIINTHAHLDHIFGVQALVDKFNIPFGIHEQELPVLNGAERTAAMFGMRFTDVPKATFYIKQGEPLKLGDDELAVLFTPGHSPGSISFYCPAGNWVIGGDVLFNGSIGRTDLPGGNFDTLIASIRTQLFTLPPTTTVFPGHGPSTTIRYEIADNPFLK